MNAPDLIEPIIGWRGWRIDDDGRLHSMHFFHIWLPRQAAEARCEYPVRHVVHGPISPVQDCTCGIYACADRERLRLNYLVRLPAVVGTVKLWGRVVRHSKGWRAQYAYPAELYVQDEAHVEALEAYGVPVVVERRMAA